MKKKISVVTLLIVVSALFTGCFSSDSPAADESAAGFHYYATDDFRIQIPNEWEVRTPNTFTSDTPKNTVIAFRNNIRGARFTSNVVILINPVSQENISSLDYGKALYEKVRDSLNDFQELAVENVKIFVDGNETEALYTVTQGREDTTADVKQYHHISAVKGDQAYVIVGAMLASEGEAITTRLQTIVRSFEIK